MVRHLVILTQITMGKYRRDKMTVNKTKSQAHDYMNKLKGKWWDFDGAFGAQCTCIGII